MISIGVHSGGPGVRDSIVGRLFTVATAAAMRARNPNYKNDEGGWINPIFIIPGAVSKPDFEGYKLGHFSRKEKGLVVQIAVPQAVADGDGIAEFIGASLREAVRLAATHFASKGISFSVLKAEKIIMVIEAELAKLVA
jgi:hypothetical protein